MNEKTFVFAADRHGREDNAEGDIYIGAGDEIYTKSRKENGETIEDYEKGILGNAQSPEQVEEYAAGEINERLSEISEKYEEAYLALGNHEDHLLPNKKLVKQISQKYDNVHIKEDDIEEIEGRNFYFGDSFQTNPDVAKAYQAYSTVSAKELGYEEEQLEQVSEALEKSETQVTCEDIDKVLEGETTVEEEPKKSFIREKLEGIPYLGESVFEPLYGIKDKITNNTTQTYEADLEMTEDHQQIKQDISEYEEMLEQKSEKLEEIDGEITMVAHSQPSTEESKGCVKNRELIKRTDNITAAYTGHFHGGFNGEQETEIEGTKVINPMEGYTVDQSGGALEQYQTRQFEGEPVAEADPIELQQSPQHQEQQLSEEKQQKAQQIVQEVQSKASSEQEARQMAQQRFAEEGITI